MTIARYEKYTVQVGDMQNMVSKRVYCISDKPTELIKIDILRKMYITSIRMCTFDFLHK